MQISPEIFHLLLCINPQEHPPDHYRLLGLGRLELNADVIGYAAERQSDHVKRFLQGDHQKNAAAIHQALLAARDCLLDHDSHQLYAGRLQGFDPDSGDLGARSAWRAFREEFDEAWRTSQDLGFDAPHHWLSIPRHQRPASNCRLLGLTEGEQTPDVIRCAAERQIAFVRKFASGDKSDDANKLLRQLSQACSTLLRATEPLDPDCEDVCQLSDRTDEIEDPARSSLIVDVVSPIVDASDADQVRTPTPLSDLNLAMEDAPSEDRYDPVSSHASESRAFESRGTTTAAVAGPTPIDPIWADAVKLAGAATSPPVRITRTSSLESRPKPQSNRLRLATVAALIVSVLLATTFLVSWGLEFGREKEVAGATAKFQSLLEKPNLDEAQVFWDRLNNEHPRIAEAASVDELHDQLGSLLKQEEDRKAQFSAALERVDTADLSATDRYELARAGSLAVTESEKAAILRVQRKLDEWEIARRTDDTRLFIEQLDMFGQRLDEIQASER